MGLDVYNKIVEIIGDLPGELQWVYGFSTIFFVVLVLLCIIYPFYRIFKG